MDNVSEDVRKLLEGKTIPEQRRIAKALGIEYKTPSIVSQIMNKGAIEKKHRGRAKDDSPYVVIPEVYLSNGKTIPGITIDPRIARATGQELLRIADKEKF